MKVRRSDVRRSTLPDSFFDASWKGVVARREAKARTARRAPALAIAAVLFAIVCFAWGRNATFSPFVARTQHDAPALGGGALGVRGGGVLDALDAPEPRTVELADGSSITLAAGARLVPVRNDARAIDLELRAGKATYDVRPGGPRVWSVRAGDVLVTVLGTRFSVSRGEDGVVVAVDRGSVMVHATRLPDHERRLVAGEQVIIANETSASLAPPVVVAEPAAAASRVVRPQDLTTAPPEPAQRNHVPVLGKGDPAPSKDDKGPTPRLGPASPSTTATMPSAPAVSGPAAAASPAATPPAASGPAASAPPASTPPAAPTRDWQSRARAADFARAYQTLGPGGIATETERTEDLQTLMLLADVARLSGHPAEAIAPLERFLRVAPRDGSASLAAFTLGKIELDSLGRPARAAVFFAKCIELGAPKSLDEDAYVRWADALARAGDRAGAERVDQLYRDRYPSGRHVGERRRPTNSP